MAEGREPKLRLPPVEQIGIVVKDMDATMEFFSSVFGWGPWGVLNDLEMKDCLYRGKSCDARLKLAFAQSGSVEIELIEYVNPCPCRVQLQNWN